MYASLTKGSGLLDCMRGSLKDRWVTASEVRAECTRGGEYTRQVLEEAAAYGLIEKKVEPNPVTKYRIDPPPGRSEPICRLQPNVPYDKSICKAMEDEIEDRAVSRFEHVPSSCEIARSNFEEMEIGTPLTGRTTAEMVRLFS